MCFFCEFFRHKVPSLYVRVYLVIVVTIINIHSSLIICEGISELSADERLFISFPHYMWGYIVLSSYASVIGLVPSLYVRVYRTKSKQEVEHYGSLIICEGISQKFSIWWNDCKFPHYMWGYIKSGVEFYSTLLVPSLYVRVYRIPESDIR